MSSQISSRNKDSSGPPEFAAARGPYESGALFHATENNAGQWSPGGMC